MRGPEYHDPFLPSKEPWGSVRYNLTTTVPDDTQKPFKDLAMYTVESMPSTCTQYKCLLNE